MNKKMLRLSILLIGLITMLAFWVRQESSRDSTASQVNAIETFADSRNANTTTRWVSNAMTVEELMLESDLVVRVRVSESPVTRVVRIESPMLDEKGNIVDTMVIKVLFSDTVLEVLETYVGKPSLEITISQNGGFDPTVSSGIEEVADDPLYKVGEEYILFLVDGSGDPIHAPDRELYRIVSPFGRYGIDGKNVFSYGQNLMRSVQRPTNIKELEAHIKKSPHRKSPSPTSSPMPTEQLITETPLPKETPLPEITPTP